MEKKCFGYMQISLACPEAHLASPPLLPLSLSAQEREFLESF